MQPTYPCIYTATQNLCRLIIYLNKSNYLKYAFEILIVRFSSHHYSTDYAKKKTIALNWFLHGMAILNIGIGICIFLVICNLKKREKKVKKLTETKGGGRSTWLSSNNFRNKQWFPWKKRNGNGSLKMQGQKYHIWLRHDYCTILVSSLVTLSQVDHNDTLDYHLQLPSLMMCSSALVFRGVDTRNSFTGNL